MYDSFYEEFDNYGETEDIDVLYDGEDFDESARSKRRLRQRARARAMARTQQKRNGQMRQKPRNVREAFSRVGSDLQKVDIENKVNTDLLGGALKAQGTRISRAEASQTLSKVLDEFQTQFPNAVTDPALKSLVSLVPLLFLKPEKKGEGIESLVKDPRFWGPAAIGVFALFNKLNKKYTITVFPPQPKVAVGNSLQLNYAIRDSSGRLVTPVPTVKWSTTDGNIILNNSGLVTGKAVTPSALVTIAIDGSNESEVVSVEVT